MLDDVFCSNWNRVGTDSGNNRGNCTEPSSPVVDSECYIYIYIIYIYTLLLAYVV